MKNKLNKKTLLFLLIFFILLIIGQIIYEETTSDIYQLRFEYYKDRKIVSEDKLTKYRKLIRDYGGEIKADYGYEATFDVRFTSKEAELFEKDNNEKYVQFYKINDVVQ
ncbi:hypothetical protein COA01_16205 [Bacillus cereus]|uniref:hypothetical protein n=1 Tax=Bacillus cereus TaxID=1396 RepID=UPI000BFE0945|nr:hypothetical protein [Bacillus cereus]PGP21080.1 hypothetical protein COA01_16205 [Bacillus cereus]